MDVKDFYAEIQLGNIAGYSIVHKFGRNDSVPNGQWELVSLLSDGSGLFMESPSTVRIKAGGNAADTANGLGAREITIIGINDTLEESIETIATSGAGASASTTNNFWRVHRSYLSEVGVYGSANSGNIIIEDSGGINDLIMIAAEEGQSQYGAYSIPLGKTGYLLDVHLTTDANKAADFRLYTRENFTNVSSPISPKRLRLYWDGILGQTEAYSPKSPGLILPALTDIWVEAEGGGAGTEVSINLEIMLIDDQSEFIRSV